eukprot:CAMPEP_0119479194 /NCGR_PEP_ID=MMETSP1344-20130328/8576_1 /TAXON_ID=236787 /ORGANISM="Florenciella parvula, Strain CCMP2471" /LENGTH=311 /DNA_ID=CAMNT_0007513411 /DNA_START=2466 /DNA_END=3399 /DNA_ORIENTATION=-
MRRRDRGCRTAPEVLEAHQLAPQQSRVRLRPRFEKYRVGLAVKYDFGRRGHFAVSELEGLGLLNVKQVVQVRAVHIPPRWGLGLGNGGARVRVRRLCRRGLVGAGAVRRLCNVDATTIDASRVPLRKVFIHDLKAVVYGENTGVGSGVGYSVGLNVGDTVGTATLSASTTTCADSPPPSPATPASGSAAVLPLPPPPPASEPLVNAAAGGSVNVLNVQKGTGYQARRHRKLDLDSLGARGGERRSWSGIIWNADSQYLRMCEKGAWQPPARQYQRQHAARPSTHPYQVRSAQQGWPYKVRRWGVGARPPGG